MACSRFGISIYRGSFKLVNEIYLPDLATWAFVKILSMKVPFFEVEIFSKGLCSWFAVMRFRISLFFAASAAFGPKSTLKSPPMTSLA